MPRILVAGVGNLFLGDDGFGPEVARRLAGRPLPDGVRVVDYGIRGAHLAYDLLDGYDALVLVDTVPAPVEDRPGRPGELRVIEVSAADLGGGELDAHGMDPVAVLAGLETLGGTLPRTVVVGCQPAGCAEGIGMSEPVQSAVEPAVQLVRQQLERLLEPSGVTVEGG